MTGPAEPQCGARNAERGLPSNRAAVRYITRRTRPVRCSPGTVSGHPCGQYLRTSAATMPFSTTCRFVPHWGHGVAVTRTRLGMQSG